MNTIPQPHIYDPGAATTPDTSSPQHEIEIKTLQVSRLKHELEVSKKRQKAREKYEPRLFALAISWLFVALVALIFQAYGWFGFYLDPAVMVSVVGSTTLNVLGLLAIALHYIFPGSSKDH